LLITAHRCRRRLK